MRGAQIEFKSKQWFGASVRSDGEHILVRHSISLKAHRYGPNRTVPQEVMGGQCCQ